MPLSCAACAIAPIIAAAGARKTERVVNAALADPSKRTLIVTYTNENQREIIVRIERKNGYFPIGNLGGRIRSLRKLFELGLPHLGHIFEGNLRSYQRAAQKIYDAFQLDRSTRDGDIDSVVAGCNVESSTELLRHIFARYRIGEEDVTEQGHRAASARQVKRGPTLHT